MVENNGLSQRSGNWSSDQRFDPESLFEVIAATESAEQATSAISHFLSEGKGDELKQAIAIYTRSARARGKTIENVLADLNGLADTRHGRYAHTGELLAPSALKKLVLTTVLEGFGGEDRRKNPR